MTEGLTVRLLGSFEVWRAGRRIHVTRARLRELIAVLALSAGRVVPVEVIGDRIWGERLPDRLRPTVQTMVSRLRALLGDEAVVAGARGEGYALGIERGQVDALRFQDLLDAAREAAHGDERGLLHEALGLWRGDAFDELPMSWFTETVAPGLTDRRLSAIERRVDLDLAESGVRLDSMVTELRDLTALHPLRESLWERLIAVLDRAGRRAEALTTYEQVTELLADELGVEPAAGLRALRSDLLAENGTTTPRLLPPDVGTFVGRERELATFDALLSRHRQTRGATTIVAVCGGGGTGKTTLVTHWAHRVAERFRDGQLYLDLRGYSVGEPLPTAAASTLLLNAMGVSDQRVPDDQVARTNLLRSTMSGRDFLLVLDNVRDVDQVRPLLPGTGSFVVVTSRHRLQSLVVREGVPRLTLGQLTAAEAAELLAARLPSRSADRDGLAELAELCRHLPLALAIVAEQVNRRPDTELATLVAELRERASDDSDLRAVFSWSFQALSRSAAFTFQALGLHPGHRIEPSVAAALTDCDEAEARSRLRDLADLHLLEEQGGDGYRMHDLVRDYANELAADVPAPDAALDRLFAWYRFSLQNARAAIDERRPMHEQESPGPNDHPAEFRTAQQAAEWCDQRHEDLILVMRAAAAAGRDQATYEMVLSSARNLIRRRDLDVLFELLGLASAAARRLEDPVAEAFVENQYGSAYRIFDDPGLAIAHFERALQLFERAGHLVGQSRALGNIGTVLSGSGDNARALGYLERSLAVKQRVDDQEGIAATLNNLSAVYIDLGRGEEAVTVARKALAFYRDHDMVRSAAVTLDTLAEAEAAQGNFTAAIDLYQQALTIHRDARDHYGEGIVLVNLGRTHLAAGSPELALTSWREALDLHERVGGRASVGLDPKEIEDLIRGVT